MGGCNSSTTTTLAAARCRSFTPRTCVQRSATARALDSVEQLPVPAQHRLRLREEGLAVGAGEPRLDLLAASGGVLVVQMGVQREVRHRRTLLEAVVLEQPGAL